MRYHDKPYIGGGQYAISGAEQDEWERYFDMKVAEIMDDPQEYERDEITEQEAEEMAEAMAYQKFGFSREHF